MTLATTVPVWKVDVRREGRWWMIYPHHREDEPFDVEEVVTQARRLTEVKAMAADLIGLLIGRGVLAADVEIATITLEHSWRDYQSVSQYVVSKRAEIKDAEAELIDRVARVVMELIDAGVVMRDVAMLVGLTSARVSQIVNQERRKP